jgi:hypothetical protein
MKNTNYDNLIVDTAKKIFEREELLKKIIEIGINEDSIQNLSLCVSEAVALVDDLKKLLAEYEPIKLIIQDVGVREIFQKIENEEAIECEKINELMRQSLKNESSSKDDPEDFFNSNFDEFMQSFHKNYDILDFYRRKLVVGPLILIDETVPKEIHAMFYELKEAFAFRLENACFVLCRMIIEKGLNDVLESHPKYKDALEINKKAFSQKWSFNLASNLNLAKYLKLISKDQYQKMDNIRLVGNGSFIQKRVQTRLKMAHYRSLKKPKPLLKVYINKSQRSLYNP